MSSTPASSVGRVRPPHAVPRSLKGEAKRQHLYRLRADDSGHVRAHPHLTGTPLEIVVSAWMAFQDDKP
jgi:hypothetical protein